MKNKILNYDFLIVGSGLIGSLAALALNKKKFKVLVVEKNNSKRKDNRTLAVNARSRDFITWLKIWELLPSLPEPIDEICILDYINKNPIKFESFGEPMGNVIFNKDLLTLAHKKLTQLKLLNKNIDIPLDQILPKQEIIISNKRYIFNKIIFCVGKKATFNHIRRKDFTNIHKSYVGFFKHQKNHLQKAYEVFTKNGPLAVLPSPSKTKKFSTFIYSTSKKISETHLKKLIKTHFQPSHGKIVFDGQVSHFDVQPHINMPKIKDIFLLGDTLRSIHPVAGQGWNLGVKDIQTLCELLDTYHIDDPFLEKIFYTRRSIESTIYLGFTSALNFLYENNNPKNEIIIRSGFKLLNKLDFLRKGFINQAMGRTNLI